MKKILTFFLTVAILCMMTTVGFAFSADNAYTLKTTVSDVNDGKVTVSFFLANNEGDSVTFEPNAKGSYNSEITIQLTVNNANCTISGITTTAGYDLTDYMTAAVTKANVYKIMCEGIGKEIIVTKDAPLFVVTLPVTQTSAGTYEIFKIDAGETYFSDKNAKDFIASDEDNLTFAPATVSYEIKGAAKTPVLTFEGVEGTKTVDESGKLVGDVPTLADKTEATFDGWAVKGTTEKVDFTTAAFTADTTFEAIWKTRTFTVKFDTDGANETVADQTVEYGKTVTDPGALTKDGYTFGGWDKDIATPITADTTFTAKWTKNHVAAVCGTELSEVKAYTDGFYYEGRYFFTANDDVVANYGVSIKGATSTKDFVGNKKVEGSAKVLYRIALLGDDEAALNAIVATPFINK